MVQYDYLDAIKTDIKSWIDENEISTFNWYDFNNKQQAAQWLDEQMWDDDGVTGNGYGGYFGKEWDAEEAICHNLDLLFEALESFGCDFKSIEKGAVYCDATIRCYLLSRAINEVLDELDPCFDLPDEYFENFEND